jgi:hypothetical protein
MAQKEPFDVSPFERGERPLLGLSVVPDVPSVGGRFIA